MEREPGLKEIQHEWHGTVQSYAIGLLLSLLMTCLSFGLVIFKVLSGKALIYTICSLAMAQAIVQLRLFLHVGQEPKPKWESLVFYFMVLVLLIIVFGSLWIMNDLDDRVMSGMMMDMNHD